VTRTERDKSELAGAEEFCELKEEEEEEEEEEEVEEVVASCA